MTDKEAIEIIKHECYIFDMGDFDLTTIVNTALDRAVNALKYRNDNGGKNNDE